MKKAFFISVFMFGLVLANPLNAQIKWSDFKNFKKYTKEDGLLPHNKVQVVEDVFGFIWIGTNDGVVRFDGSDFEHFDSFKEDDYSKNIGSSNWISIDEVEQRIILASQNGLLLSDLVNIDFRELTFYFPEIAFDKKFINSVFIDKSNILWVGVSGEGLYKIDLTTQRMENFSLSSDAPNHSPSDLNSIDRIEQDMTNNDILWLGTHQGLVEFNISTGLYEVYYHQNDASLLINRSRTMVQSENEIYIGSFKKGWYVFDKKTKETFLPIDEHSKHYQETIQNMYLDDFGSLWISSNASSVQFDLNSKKVTNSQFGIFGPGISLIDSRGIIWHANGDGLYSFDRDPYSKFIECGEQVEDIPIITVNIVKIGDDYYICPYYGKGIHKVNPTDQTVTTFPTPHMPIQHESLGPIYRFRDLIKTPDDNLIILADDRMVLFDTSKEQSMFPPVQLPDSTMIYRGSIIRDRDNNYWIGSHTQGLFKVNFDSLKIENYHEQFKGLNLREHRYIKKLFVDSKRRLWIGQAATSIMDLETSNIICLNPDLDYPIYEVFGNFFENDNGRIWIANWVNGISYVDGDNLDAGMNKVLEGSFTGIFEFEKDRLWTIGSEGLGVLDTDSFSHTILKMNIDVDFTGPVVDMGNGEFMIGCMNGVLVYNHEMHLSNEEFPKIYIREIRANNRVLQNEFRFDGLNMSLPSGTKSINLKIGSLAFKDPDNISYQYRLDDTWIDLGLGKEINLSNLSQGKYELELKAVTGLGNNEDPKRFIFIVEPYWYTTNLSYVIYLLLIGSIIYALYIFNLRRKLAIVESHRVKELNEMKSKMYANISHEFRTPLTIIRGLSDSLLKQTKDSDQQKLIKGIDQSNDQLLSLVNQMLDLASLDANQMEVHYKNGDIVAFLEKIVGLYRSYSDSKQQTLKFTTNTKSLDMDFDDEKIQKILNNLLSNAMKFTPAGGVIRVNFEEKKDQVKIKIEDDGRGIKKKDLPIIFDRHYKTTDLKGAVGSGIGLALTKELVELMEGSISVKSKPNNWTQFVITLPLKNTAEQSEITHFQPFIKESIEPINHLSQVKLENPNQTILLVEDNKDIRNFISSLLGSQYQIILAEHGGEGLKKTAKNDIDFIISDVMMPEMDGFEFCEKIKSNVETSHLPFIMLSARTRSQDKQRAYELGVDAYLTKPFNPSELMLIIENILAKQKNQKQLLLQLLSINQPEVESPDLNKLDLDLMIELQKLILDGPSKLSANEIARKLLVSRSQLHRKVKALTGKSLTNYANHIKVEKAKHLLATTDLQVKEIAYSLGYESPTYFNRLFKKETNQTPEYFREAGLSV